MSRYHALRVRAVVDETHDTKSLVFDVRPHWPTLSPTSRASS